MIDFGGKRLMILAPHTDDGELGCGGTIARAIEQGAEVFYTAFSICEESLPEGVEEDRLENEMNAAMDVLGVARDNIIVHRFRVRHFPELRQEILQAIIETKKEVSPDIVFAPSVNDIHQDHNVIAHECLRAYKDRTILSYELPWNNLTINTTAFVNLEEKHVQIKFDALSCYETQQHRPYCSKEALFSLAYTRGVQVGCKYAEVFEVPRLVI